MCAADAHDYIRVIDGLAHPAPVVCFNCGKPLDNAVLSRIVEEVRNKDPDSIHAFDRIHTRHNR